VLRGGRRPTKQSPSREGTLRAFAHSLFEARGSQHLHLAQVQV